MSYLRNKMKLNIDKITVWVEEENGSDDAYGRPSKEWKKTVYKGRWENARKITRNMKGDTVVSIANVILPVLLDPEIKYLIENGESEALEPSNKAKAILSDEEITQIRKPAKEWIYYL